MVRKGWVSILRSALIGCTVSWLTFVLSSAYGDEVALGLNGLEWGRLSKLPAGGREEKMLIVRGIFDGLWMSGSLEKGYYCTTRSYVNQVKALDQFYTDVRNYNIPVVNALQVVCYEHKGKSEAMIEDLLRFMRRHYGARMAK